MPWQLSHDPILEHAIRAAATSRPAPTTPPAADYTRTAPVVPAPTATGAPPAPAPAGPAPQPSKPSSNDSPLDAFSKNISKGNVEDFLEEMPGLRKQVGF